MHRGTCHGFQVKEKESFHVLSHRSSEVKGCPHLLFFLHKLATNPRRPKAGGARPSPQCLSVAVPQRDAVSGSSAMTDRRDFRLPGLPSCKGRWLGPALEVLGLPSEEASLALWDPTPKTCESSRWPRMFCVMPD